MIQLAPTSEDYGILTRSEFLDEFEFRYFPGQHVIAMGPTGRGKTTLIGELLGHGTMPKTAGLITIQNGPDKALNHLGKPVKSWPPPLLAMAMYDDKEKKRCFARRYQPLITKREHFIASRKQAARILTWMYGRKNWTVVLPDMQLLADPGMMGLGKDIDALIITLRKRFSSVWMDVQAPRWLPRSSNDQPSHFLIWRTRDEATIRRLAQIAGLDMKFILYLFDQMEMEVLDGGRIRADTLWIDSLRDEFMIVKGS